MPKLLPAITLLSLVSLTITTSGERPELCIPSLIGDYYGDTANEAFKQRLALCPDINQKDEYGNTALLHAVSRGSAETVKAILAAGADPTIGNRDFTPLKMACQISNGPVIRLLLEALASKEIDKKILSYCTLDGPATSDLIKNGAEVNCRDQEGNTPLILATRLNNNQVVTILLQNKARVNAKNKMGESALFWAAYNGNISLIKSLLAAGAKVNSPSKHIATLPGKNGHPATRQKVTPVITALQRGQLAAAQELINAGARLPGQP